jgi:hypothetical protein
LVSSAHVCACPPAIKSYAAFVEATTLKNTKIKIGALRERDPGNAERDADRGVDIIHAASL